MYTADERWPLPPRGDIDWQRLGFEPLEVNGHVECHFTAATGSWSSPEVVVDPYLRIHGLAPSLNYAQQIFEGMKAFRTPSGGVQLFRPDLNAERFARSATYVSIPPVDRDIFLQAVQLAVGINSEYVPPHQSGGALYIRPIAFASSAGVGLSLATRYTFCVYVLPVSSLHGGQARQGADALVVEDFDRAAPLGTGSVKVGGNYGPVLGLIDAAKREGYALTLHLDSQGHSLIDEFSTSGFIGVHVFGGEGGGPRLVVSTSSQIVDSVTVRSVCELAVGLGWSVEKRAASTDYTASCVVNTRDMQQGRSLLTWHASQIPLIEAAHFAEVFAGGTAAVLVPVRSIVRRSTGQKFTYNADYSSADSCFARLYALLAGIQTGAIVDQHGWTVPVLSPGTHTTTTL